MREERIHQPLESVGYQKSEGEICSPEEDQIAELTTTPWSAANIANS